MNNGQLDVWESLLIRNIKGKRFSLRALRRIWARRCGLELADVNEWVVLSAIASMADELKLTTLAGLVGKCEEQERWFKMIHGREPLRVELLTFAMCSVLKFTYGSKLPGYRVPTWFSRKHKGSTP